MEYATPIIANAPRKRKTVFKGRLRTDAARRHIDSRDCARRRCPPHQFMPLAGGVPRREAWGISEDATNWYALGDSADTPRDDRAAVIFVPRRTQRCGAPVFIRRKPADRKCRAGGALRMRTGCAVAAMSMVATSVPTGTRIWLAAGATDMRKGFTGLSALVQNALASNPFCGHLFVFRGRRGDLLKLLWWDGSGLCLLAKRLERGRFIWPQAQNGARVCDFAILKCPLRKRGSCSIRCSLP